MVLIWKNMEIEICYNRLKNFALVFIFWGAGSIKSTHALTVKVIPNIENFTKGGIFNDSLLIKIPTQAPLFGYLAQNWGIKFPKNINKNAIHEDDFLSIWEPKIWNDFWDSLKIQQFH